MSDERSGTPAARAGGRGMLGFLAETLASLRNPRLLVPAVLLAALLTASNIVILLNAPRPGEVPIAFALAAFARIAGLLIFSVGLLRILTGSARPPFRPDGAFWLYAATLLLSLVLGAALGAVGGDPADPVRRAAASLAVIALTAPLSVWFTAIAVDRPLAANPRPWLRGFSRWLPAVILWSVLIVFPLGQLHAAIDLILIRGAGRWFWPLALIDGPLSALLALFGFALAATAYRSVARR